MKRIIKFGPEAREKLLNGVELAATAIRTTLGPRGAAAIIHTQAQSFPLLADDGALVSKCIQSADAAENTGCSIIREVATQADDGGGDGTTSATIFAHAVIKDAIDAVNNGAAKKKVKDGIVAATKLANDEISTLIHNVENREQLRNIAFVSSNDMEIANLVADAVDSVGKYGVVQVEEGTMQETKVIRANGIKFERGFVDRLLTTDPVRGIFEVKDCRILILDHELDNVAEAIKILELAITKSVPILIICNGCRNDAALAYLRANRQQYGLKLCIVKAPGHGDLKVQYLQDIADATGGTVFGTTTGAALDKLQADPSKPNCNSDDFLHLLGTGDVTVNQHETTIVLKEMTEAAKETAEKLKAQLDGNELSEYDRNIVQDRLANLTSGIALIKVGGSTDTEIAAKKVKIDDAKNATVSANKYGYVLGGGSAYVWASMRLGEAIAAMEEDADKDFVTGMKIVASALLQVTTQLIVNSGEDPATFLADIINTMHKEKKPEYGFDALNNKVVNMYKEGIIDSARVVSNSLVKALSVASTVIMAETLITEEAEETDKINFGLLNRK